MSVKLRIKVLPGKKQNKIEISGEEIKISIKEPAREGMANKAVIELISRKLKIPKSSVIILHGLKSRNKVIHIEGIDGKDEILRRLVN
ncbi:MAG TPA: DUF167 domain-containing protein [candidate division WOR-3 bacterium]|uniref:UPF0235 protein ENH14_04125 n=1 Tax=candidate division WOR-3 bacterium TaxID=2052148 RepID=A0A7V0LUR6_UNCW3|nr:DUF167 domain-containing protein [Candidatus Hydrothermae bacterium]RKY97256.1 MAG: DUF167 domain-containing protein [Candidatus Hydrothermae bacterium]HDL60627.1 DUF167 domain-containing protein [candidate division WOR-3 bacterium]